MLPAILFDLDGTLIDSEPFWRRALASFVKTRCGGSADQALDDLVGTMLDELVGRTASEAVRALGRQLRWAVDRLADDVRCVEELVGASLLDGVVWRDGALDLVRTLREAEARIGLVTSSAGSVVAAVCADEGCPTFDVIVNGDEVRAAKPAPDPYRTAARRLGLEPQACVAIEDSKVGVDSALAAGCAVVAVGPNATGSDPGQWLHVDTLREVTVAAIVELQRKHAVYPGAS